MNLAEFLAVLKRHIVTVCAVIAVVLGATALWLSLQTPIYEATTTLGLVPIASAGSNPLLSVGQVNGVTTIYSEAATAPETRDLAVRRMPPGVPLGSIDVTVFTDAPLIINLSVKGADPKAAQLSALSYAAALRDRVNIGQVGLRDFIQLQTLKRPVVPESPVSPRRGLTVAVGAVLALAAAIAAALLHENLSRGTTVGRPRRGQPTQRRSVVQNPASATTDEATRGLPVDPRVAADRSGERSRQ